MNEYIVEIIYSQYGEGTVFKEKLVRCKDCKYWDTDHEGTDLMFCHISDWNRLTRGAEDYCSKAERKEE